MSFLNRLSVGRRLALGFALIIALIIVMLLAMQAQLKEVQRANTILQQEQAERLALAKEWRENIIVNVARALALGVTANETLLKFFSDDMAYLVKRTTEIQKRYAELDVSDEGKAILARMAEERKRYLVVRQQLEEVGADAQTRQKLVYDMKSISTAYVNAGSELVRYQERRTAEFGGKIEDAIQKSKMVLLSITTASIVFSILLAWLLTRSIASPLREMERITLKIAEGDLSSTVPVLHGKSEIASFSRNVGSMQESLRSLVSKSRRAALAVSQASTEAAAGNSDLSGRTEQAASSLEETASAMEQIAATVQQSADFARAASAQVSQASEVAQHGGQVMSDVVQTMDRIDEASRKIADIIGVIDGIAFQTNILALNAAVEAARAGEQGRGFAVVASEVRSLAQRSATAAREIKDLISASLAAVEGGSSLVNNAGKIIQDVVQNVDLVRQTIAEIAVAAQEQSRGVGEINEAISQLEQATQRNAALVEETNSATTQLNQQASVLAEVISDFKLPEQYQ
ncbi:methyl-accepting chemotaxis protein [Herbaspirillum sp. DW155]|nr:methyl-accepting chemotaxis protein [Herbaspirillum sp. DW155]